VLGADATQAVDIYALGLVLLESVTGQQEYEGNGVEAAVARLHRPPRVPRDVPEPLAGAILAMTAQAPERRPAITECAELLAGRPIARPARRRWALIGVASGGLGAAVAAALLAMPSQSDSPALQPALPAGDAPSISAPPTGAASTDFPPAGDRPERNATASTAPVTITQPPMSNAAAQAPGTSTVTSVSTVHGNGKPTKTKSTTMPGNGRGTD